MFSPYGIGISRDWLYENKGARPVIYGQADEINLLDESIRWRFLEFDIHNFVLSARTNTQIIGEKL